MEWQNYSIDYETADRVWRILLLEQIKQRRFQECL